MEEYKGKYSSKSQRLKGWDYGTDGYYFITICTKNKKCFFGEVNNDCMNFSIEGSIAAKYLIEIKQQFPYLQTEGFVVMPNHIHVILIVNIGKVKRVSTSITKNIGGFTGSKNPMLNNGISKAIRWYKGRVTFEIRKNNPDFNWQANYHDHIIRNEKSYQEIVEYINNNPLKWSLDRFNPTNETKL